MSISRRNLLQYTGTGCALALLAPALRAAGSLRFFEVSDTVALPRFAAGDVVVADTAVSRFTTNGLYLYPAWGAPRLYDVRAAAGFLEFRNPGTGLLLWKQAAAFDSAFAGKVLEDARADTAAAAIYPALGVPALPTTT